MSNIHPLQNPSSSAERLRLLLDEAELERTRLNRRIRRLRSAIKAVQSGEEPPDIQEILRQTRPPRRVVEAARLPVSPETRRLHTPAPPAAEAHPFATRLGDPMPPGVSSPMPAPAVHGRSSPPSVDVGALGRMTPEALDGLPFGVVTLDARGKVVGYNDTESRLAGLPRDAVIGRNFFRDVAPCTRVREFEGRFLDFAGGRSRMGLETFDFVFNFKKGAQHVSIFVSPARYRGQFHVSMVRR